MTEDDTDDFDYATVVIETLRKAGGPISGDQLWDRVMRRSDVPADDKESYWTPPFKPGPYPRNFVMLKLTASLMAHTDMRGRRPDAPLWTTEEGYWLPEWGPLPIIEQQRRTQLEEPPTRPSPARKLSDATKQTGGGCYVATCVYGDYDAPQVLVLRQWRDQVLCQSHLGRSFVRFYYAVSPRLVRAIGNRRWFSIPTRFALDRLVRKLDS